MTRSLATALVTSKNQANKSSPLAWIFRVQASSSDAFRLAIYSSNITTYEGTSAPYTATTYSAFPMRIEDIQFDQAGSLESWRLVVSNISQEVQTYLDLNDMTGKEVRVRLVDTSALGDSSNATAFMLDERLQILGIEANLREVSFEIGHFLLLKKQVPATAWNRNRCRHRFGSPECAFPLSVTGTATGTQDGYDLTQVSVTSCDLGFSTPNGCKAHGAFEKAMGLPVYHPRRFGGFPGIPKGRGY